MSSKRVRTWPLRWWLVVELIAIVGMPALTTWALSTTLTARQGTGDVATLATINRIVGDAPAHWHEAAWQREARQRFAALHVDVLLVDPAGHHVFATSGATGPTGWWLWRDYLGAPIPAVPIGRHTLPRRALTTVPLYQFSPLQNTRHATSGHVGEAVLAGIAFIWLVPFTPPPDPPAWLVPAAGLAALVATLAVVAWCVGRLVLRPLAAMSRAADQIAGGDLNVWLPASQAREVAEVASALAGMSAALQAALARQASLEEERKLFIGAIAHDLHTPLFVLRGYLQGLENGVVASPEKVAAYCAECRARVDALGRLIADLFAYTKVEYLDQAIQREPLDLSSLLAQVLAGLRSLAIQRHLVLTLDGPEAPCPVEGDGHLLTRAVENLLDNALRHTPEGGEIRVNWGVEGDQIVVRVMDTGPGISSADLPHLFTPFYRGEASRNRQTGGAGLGLAIARRILQAHGGALTAANRRSGGAVFAATLPCLPAGSRQSAEKCRYLPQTGP
jgi:signal transduction histidine kinase